MDIVEVPSEEHVGDTDTIVGWDGTLFTVIVPANWILVVQPTVSTV